MVEEVQFIEAKVLKDCVYQILVDLNARVFIFVLPVEFIKQGLDIIWVQLLVILIPVVISQPIEQPIWISEVFSHSTEISPHSSPGPVPIDSDVLPLLC